MKSKKRVRIIIGIIIAIPVIFVIALAFLYVLTLFMNENDTRWLNIRPKHSLAKFSKYKEEMVGCIEAVGKPTITIEGCCSRTHYYKLEKNWLFKVANSGDYIVDYINDNRYFNVDYANRRVFKLEDDEYITTQSYLRGSGTFTGGSDNMPKHSLAKFSKIKIGMSPAKVTKLAGKPTVSVDSSFIWYRYKIDTGWYMDLHFFNDKLSDMSIVDFPNNRVFELEQEDYITTLPCPSTVAQIDGNSASGTFTDDRDGRAYRTVKVGESTWMAENLDFVTDSSVCSDNDESNCTKYGRLYNWDDATKACPAGWRLPGDEDWAKLTLAVANKCNGRIHWGMAAKKLKTTTGWYSDSYDRGNGTDDIGFSALPGGYRVKIGNDVFLGAGRYGKWWSATETDVKSVGRWEIYNDLNRGSIDKERMFSVRCVRE